MKVTGVAVRLTRTSTFFCISSAMGPFVLPLSLQSVVLIMQGARVLEREDQIVEKKVGVHIWAQLPWTHGLSIGISIGIANRGKLTEQFRLGCLAKLERN